MDPCTSKFLQARPFAVLPVSPALAALYTIQSPDLPNNPDWCSKCGSYLLNGSVVVRIARRRVKTNDQKQRAVRLTCRCCGWKVETLAGRGYPTSASSIVAQNSYTLRSSSVPIPPAPTPPAASPSPSIPSLSVPTKARNKKKSGLQILLSQNRDKETRRLGNKDEETAGGGLAAFLSGI